MTTDPTSYELAELVGLVSAARRRAGVGGSVDLQSLPERIASICDAITAMPARRAQGYRKALDGLLDDLDALGAELRLHHDELRLRLAAIAGGDDNAAD
jgi:hypothetical protein